MGTFITVSQMVENAMERYEKEREIRCPYCDKLQSNDDWQYPVTYHGEDGPVEWTCDNPDCEKKFYVEEIVERTYSVGKSLNKYGSIVEE